MRFFQKQHFLQHQTILTALISHCEFFPLLEFLLIRPKLEGKIRQTLIKDVIDRQEMEVPKPRYAAASFSCHDVMSLRPSPLCVICPSLPFI